MGRVSRFIVRRKLHAGLISDTGYGIDFTMHTNGTDKREVFTG